MLSGSLLFDQMTLNKSSSSYMHNDEPSSCCFGIMSFKKNNAKSKQEEKEKQMEIDYYHKIFERYMLNG
jgi:hypothetical protein